MWQGTVDLYPVWGGTLGLKEHPPEGRLSYKGGNSITLSPQTISLIRGHVVGMTQLFGSKDVHDFQ